MIIRVHRLLSHNALFCVMFLIHSLVCCAWWMFMWLKQNFFQKRIMAWVIMVSVGLTPDLLTTFTSIMHIISTWTCNKPTGYFASSTMIAFCTYHTTDQQYNVHTIIKLMYTNTKYKYCCIYQYINRVWNFDCHFL